MPLSSTVREHFKDAHIIQADYRRDIDGLRALAVAAVLIFHAFPSLLPGGFVGVDVFFVISGYLISKHIFSELDDGAFTLRTFYARRVRRIFPALILVLSCCVAIGWIVLTPDEYRALGRAIAGGAGFVANFVFWKEAGYFDIASDSKPLLHLWSLGVEEQFYIIWPLILLFFWPRKIRKDWLIGGLLLASLLYSLALVRSDVTADFYSPLSRFWELALGAGVAYATLYGHVLRSRILDLASWLGIGLIVGAFSLLNNTQPFPGALALLPTLGAALLIYAGPSASINRHLLALRPLVWIGLISYPLYLWHWPLLSFGRIIESATPAVEVRVVLLVISVLLAWMTYLLLERPVRSACSKNNRLVIASLCLLMFALIVGGTVIYKQRGFKGRHLDMLNGDVSTLVIGADRDRFQRQCGLSQESLKTYKYAYCLTDPLKQKEAGFAILGDSKGEPLFYGLSRIADWDARGIFIGSIRPPAADWSADDSGEAMNRLGVQAVLNQSSIRLVILANAMRGSFPTNRDTGFIDGTPYLPGEVWMENYGRLIRELEQAGKRVVFVIDNPTFPDPRSCISGGLTSSATFNKILRRKQNPFCTITLTDHLLGTAAYLQRVDELKRRYPSLIVYDPTQLVCDLGQNRCSTTRDGKFLYSYGDHYSDYASDIIARNLLSLIPSLAIP